MFKKSSEPEDRPEADESIMNEAYEAIAEAAKAMDIDTLDTVFQGMTAFSVPLSHSEKWEKLKNAYNAFDYDTLVSLLSL